ncbi:MAG TPA: hypothetical protein VN809_07035, partial [Telmatospirillum sp.]|nr:hypothetical protein [Telmatospirillum sp.]
LLLLRHIRDLLYKDGYTIRGVQKLLRDQARTPIKSAAKTPASVTKEAAETDGAIVGVASDDLAAEAAAPEAPASAVVPVQPDLLLDVASLQDGDVRSELKRLLGELEEIRSLLAQARQG